jgi:hypothetical protein
MKAKSGMQELERIRRDIGSSLRTGPDAAEPAPPSLLALLRELETRVRDNERDRLFAEVDARLAELMRPAGRSLEH